MRPFAYLLLAATAGCASSSAAGSSISPAPKTSARPIALTYTGVAGWQIESAGKTILVDPYFSRPNLDGVIESDPAAVAAGSPNRADLIVVGHSHVDHLLDVPAVAIATGAQIMGSASTVAVASAKNVPADRLIPIRGGEDYQFDGFSVRVIPSLHSALDDKHFAQGAQITVIPPQRFDDYTDGGTFNYLLRVGDHEVYVSSTANFIERELVGLNPDIAIIATGLREEIFDYTCRLMRLLDYPEVVYATHFDNWRAAPVDEALGDDLAAFVREVRSCSPRTNVIIPKHFVRMTN